MAPNSTPSSRHRTPTASVTTGRTAHRRWIFLCVISTLWLGLSLVWMVWCYRLLNVSNNSKSQRKFSVSQAVRIEHSGNNRTTTSTGSIASSSSAAAAVDHATEEVLLSTLHYNVKVTTDVHGNLAAPHPTLLDPNGTDWIHDRWQAASDMHGTAIRGQHWVQLDWRTSSSNRSTRIVPSRIILDWETSFSNDYRIVGSCCSQHEKVPSTTVVLYDTAQEQRSKNAAAPPPPPHRTTRSWGQSPGVKQKLPLHVMDTIDLVASSHSIRHKDAFDRIWLDIRTPFHKSWGVSLWSIQVFGTLDG